MPKRNDRGKGDEIQAEAEAPAVKRPLINVAKGRNGRFVSSYKKEDKTELDKDSKDRDLHVQDPGYMYKTAK
jgi:hypothetical protein